MLTEKYRPKTLDEILGQKRIVASLKGYVESGEMPNCLFVGKSGNGKTAAAWALAYELGCAPGSTSFLELNASDERGIAIVREKIKNFAQTKAITEHGFKICLLDEADELTKQAQQALRRVMERYHKTVRFILTANSLGKMSQAILSRTAKYSFRKLHPTHVRTILMKVQMGEGTRFGADINSAIITSASGDARAALNMYEALMSMDDVTVEDIATLSGSVSEENVWSMMHTALKGDVRALDKMKAILDQGGNASKLMNTMYFTAMKGSAPGMTTLKRLRILQAVGTIPGTTDEFRLAGALAKMLEMSGDFKE